jgi:hypothetical protein
VSATALGAREPVRLPAPSGATRVWSPPLLRALLVSRLLILLAGCAGARAVPWRTNWQVFDPMLLSSHLGAVGNVLAGAAVRWDSVHYLEIAAHGYTTPVGTVFYPLYPVLMHVGALVLGSEAVAGVVVSLASLFIALVLLARLTELELGARAAQTTVVLLCFAPLSFFFSAVYTESLFLALSVGAVYAARTDRWRLSVGLASLAAVTRVTGVALAIPLLIMRCRHEARWRVRIATVAPIPATLLSYLAGLALYGDSPLAPFREEVNYGRHTAGPLGALALAVKAAAKGARLLTSGVESIYMPSINGPLSIGAESIMLLGVLVLGLAVLRLAWRRLPREYGAYAAATLALSVWSPASGQPLMSLDRYLLTIFPLWMIAGAWLAERTVVVRRGVLIASAGLLAFFTFQFATWAFIA